MVWVEARLHQSDRFLGCGEELTVVGDVITFKQRKKETPNRYTAASTHS